MSNVALTGSHFYVRNCQNAMRFTQPNFVIGEMLAAIHRYVVRYRYFQYYRYSDIEFKTETLANDIE